MNSINLIGIEPIFALTGVEIVIIAALLLIIAAALVVLTYRLG